MHIALDYDDTYTRDPLLWDRFIELAAALQARVSIVTFRDRTHDWTPMLESLQQRIPVHCTAGVAKKFYMLHFAKDPVDVWIDDNPAGILGNSTFSVEGLAEWRAANARTAAEIERPAA